MRKFGTILVAATFWAGLIPAHGADLTGTASVNVTSDTAAAAKNMALDQARRQIITENLRQYALVDQLMPALSQAKSGDLTNLIATTGIDGERISDTTYSANITMTIDRDAARRWMAENNVQNWLNDGTGGDTFVVMATLGDAMVDWIDLNRIARAEKIDLGTKFISGRSVMLEIPTSVRSAFINAVRETGWRYAPSDGMLRIWR